MKTTTNKFLRYWCFLPMLFMSLMVQGHEKDVLLTTNDTSLSVTNENVTIAPDATPVASFEKSDDNPPKITICHYPPGNPGNVQTIEISPSAWAAHEAHGDSMGACNGGSDDEDSDDNDDNDDNDDDDDNSNNNNNKITICHYPPGNPGNVQTIEISPSAWPAHEAHGDSMGACSSEEEEEEEEEEGCYAMEVVDYNPTLQSNGNAISEDRTDATVTLGEPDRSNAAGGFASLGINGSITLQFAGAVYNSDGVDIKIYETSFSGDTCGGSDDESSLVEVSQDGINWFSAGEICRDGEIDLDGIPVIYVIQIRITDTTTGSGDGYDVDGVEAVYGCQDLPNEETDPCYGSFVVENSYAPGLQKNGQPITDPQRIDPSKALGAPQVDNTLNFVSLGYGGEVVIGFDDAVVNQAGNDLEIVETTFGEATFVSYPESADVFVSQDGNNYYFIGAVFTDELAQLDISNAADYLSYITYVKLVDTTPEGSISTDGYDLDGIVALPGCVSIDIAQGASTNSESSAALHLEKQAMLNTEIQMYPVPAKNILNVRLDSPTSGTLSYEVFSIMGQSLNKGVVENYTGQTEINTDISNLPDGAYFMLINLNGETISKKFIKSTK